MALETHTFDLVVVEATPAGIAMAVRAAREGLSVLLAHRGLHIGGMLSSGLGVWDGLFEGRRAPVYDEVRQAILDYYRNVYGEKSPQYAAALPGKGGHRNGCFEPSVAERVLERIVAAESRLRLRREWRPVSVRTEAARVASVRFETPAGEVEVAAAAFADCTYEGDLAALAGAPFRLGREGREEHGEPHAGWIHTRPATGPATREAAAFAERRRGWALRHFESFQEEVPSPGRGRGDDRIQAYNYRTILTDNPANRLIPAPSRSYDRSQYAGLEYASLVGPLPNRKYSWNRPQLPGLSQAYPRGDDTKRRAVRDAHWEATIGLLHFLQHDAGVPADVRAFWSNLGLARDEFADHGHRPYELYVREARRIVGRATLTEHDFLPTEPGDRAPARDDAIAGTDWYVDVHACGSERVGDSFREGKLLLHQETVPGQVPYGALLPCNRDNLLVPVCLSATHVAFSAVRVEPIWMAVGEAAGVAAALACRAGTAPAFVDMAELRSALHARGIVTAPLGRKREQSAETPAALSQHGL